MTRVNLICATCGHTARRDLAFEVACRGTHETSSEPATCPKGHGLMVREDGVQQFPVLIKTIKGQRVK